MINTWKCLIFASILLSTFCTILYDAVSTRFAFSHFGSTVSVLTSVMMAGLGGAIAGAWVSGRWIGEWCNRYKAFPITIFALTEAASGFLALMVPFAFQIVSDHLASQGTLSIGQFSLSSWLCIFFILFPLMFLKGTAIISVTEYTKRFRTSQTHTFSFLYLAAAAGCALSVFFVWGFFIELYGFQFTLGLGAAINFVVAVIGVGMGRRFPVRTVTPAKKIAASFETVDVQKTSRAIRYPEPLRSLFLAGASAAAMQVILMRGFAAVTETSVYANALNLIGFFIPCWLGALRYRAHLQQDKMHSVFALWAMLAASVYLPLILSDPLIGGTAYWILLALIPFYGALGYLVPMLIDAFSDGEAPKVGQAYSLHLTGGLVGGLLTCFVAVPILGVKGALLVVLLPILVALVRSASVYQVSLKRTGGAMGVSLFTVILSFFVFSTFEEREGHRVQRDPASIAVAVSDATSKSLIINGFKYASGNTEAKIMGHLPVVLHTGAPKSALLLGVGIGDTLRALTSWGLAVTAIEELPSVIGLLPTATRSQAKIIQDDARRFLARTDKVYDLIVVEPPAQAEMANSSLLYSEEFYKMVKGHLSADGIVHQWMPEGESRITEAVIHSLVRSFPYLKVFRYGEVGLHFIGSRVPILVPSVTEIVPRIPEMAAKDLMEYESTRELPQVLTAVVDNQLDMSIVGQEHEIRITDDNPINEYYFIRRSFPSYFESPEEVTFFPKAVMIAPASAN